MRAYEAELENVTPLLMHRDNLEFKPTVERWQRDPANRDKSIPGDDRSPAWGWLGSLYHDGKVVALPTDCVMASCMGAGAEVKAGRGRKSLKAQTQSGMAFAEPFLAFTCNGGTSIKMAALQSLAQEENFDQHVAVVRDQGFALDIRRVRIGDRKNVRVRPVFDTWHARGVLNVWDDALTEDALATVFYLAGDKYGLCEWRPSGRRPGPFGRFRATLKPLA
jgi:hypothetical protein